MEIARQELLPFPQIARSIRLFIFLNARRKSLKVDAPLGYERGISHFLESLEFFQLLTAAPLARVSLRFLSDFVVQL